MLAEMRANIQREVAEKARKRKPIGVDGLNFEMTVGGANSVPYLESAPLQNRHGQKYGDVEIDKGVIKISLSPSKYLWGDNITPFGMVDANNLAPLTSDLIQAVSDILRGNVDDDTDLISATARSIECNITMPVVGEATCSQVLNLINIADHDGTNVVYQQASFKCKYVKENETVIIRKKNYYTLKCYNKSLQQQREGNPVGKGLLRIEIIMQGRTIKRLFDKKATIRDVLTERGLRKIIDEYKRIFKEVKRGYIWPCLAGVRKILSETLMETGSQKETIAIHKQLIVDEQVFRRALTKWYVSNGYDEKRAKRNADTYICRNKARYDFPENVIDTIEKFAKLCK